MTKGFGEVPQQNITKKPKISEADKSAAKHYDDLAKTGISYNIYLRQKTSPGDKEASWFPCGVMAVTREDLINGALYENEKALLKGARKLYPNMKLDDLEYGVQIKGKGKEVAYPIDVAVKPLPTTKGFFDGVISSVKNALNLNK
eukprot:CAMPEP_0184646008 /NCGR_PEP_ID=MMETSP0308-20130426/2649_1 /TAXON_ID=38269 /ORGANISM="Gloeochaete witrockiana, Strain SAG 46.84" /LENGTH=144 /DNA_ID=CAMNT_0027075627 /DNA_START=186 /DNA_END=620 /DNA_ORIENTATION=-